MIDPCEFCKHNEENEDAWCLDCDAFKNFAPFASVEEVEDLRELLSSLEANFDSLPVHIQEAVETARGEE